MPTLTAAETAALFGDEYVAHGVATVVDLPTPAPAGPRCPGCGCEFESRQGLVKHMARAYRLLPDEAEAAARAFRAA